MFSVFRFHTSARGSTLLVAMGGLLYLCSTVAFLLYGRLNADERWYIHASRMDYDGLHPIP